LYIGREILGNRFPEPIYVLELEKMEITPYQSNVSNTGQGNFEKKILKSKGFENAI